MLSLSFLTYVSKIGNFHVKEPSNDGNLVDNVVQSGDGNELIFFMGLQMVHSLVVLIRMGLVAETMKEDRGSFESNDFEFMVNKDNKEKEKSKNIRKSSE